MTDLYYAAQEEKELLGKSISERLEQLLARHEPQVTDCSNHKQITIGELSIKAYKHSDTVDIEFNNNVVQFTIGEIEDLCTILYDYK
jgi:hypothetical protein